jgi:zinc finger protein
MQIFRPFPLMDPLFLNFTEDQPLNQIESLCIECHQNGMTTLMLTKIPHFKEVILSSFQCDHCGNRNNSVQFAQTIEEQGIHITLKAAKTQDLDRQVVLTEFSTVRLEELDFEIPPSQSRTTLTTIEGILFHCISDLIKINELNAESADSEFLQKISQVTQQLNEYKSGKCSFTLCIDDPSGNSYVQRFDDQEEDSSLKIKHYERNPEQMQAFGFASPDEQQPANEEIDERLNSIPTDCPNCGVACETRICSVEIPHFKQIVIFCTKCDSCGYLSNEVKSGGEISPKGIHITLTIRDEEDLNRDILKSDSCNFCIPSIGLEVTHGSLGGKFTTIEGILLEIHQDLLERVPFASGDSADVSRKAKFKELADKVKEITEGKIFGCVIEMDDPLGNSYVQNIYIPDPDPSLQIVEYTRTFEQNEAFGLNSIQLLEEQTEEKE